MTELTPMKAAMVSGVHAHIRAVELLEPRVSLDKDIT
jgi:hypothetical protein